MPAPTETHSRSLSTGSTDLQDRSQTPSPVGSGVYDDSVIPPSHNARTVVLCFDGTGDQFDGDVCAHSSSYCLSLNIRVACRIRTSYSSSRCSRRTIRAGRWSTIRSAKRVFVLVRQQLKTQHSSLASGRTRFRRLCPRSGQACTS